MDQLESPTPGLFAQLTGIPTTQKYKCIKVFMDNYTRFTYVQLQQSNSLEETLQAKIDFKMMAERLKSKSTITMPTTGDLQTTNLSNM
jgi:hypothetical protein